jgi:hypothetical protein
MAGMNADESGRRSWFNPRVAVVLGFLTLVACSAAWKWRESVARRECLSDLTARAAIYRRSCTKPGEWSSEWPFYNAHSLTSLCLDAGKSTDDDVLRLGHIWVRPGRYY